MKSALEDVKKLQSSTPTTSKEAIAEKSKIKSSSKWSLTRWISVIAVSGILSTIFLPGLLPLFLMLSGRTIHQDPLTPWMIGVGDQPGQALWTLASVISGMALFFGLVTLVLWLLLIALGEADGKGK